MINPFVLADEQTAADMQAYLGRAKRLDPDGLVRLRAFGAVLAAYVAPIYSGNLMDSGPTVLGLRTCELAEPAELDALVPIASVQERLAKLLSDNETVEFKIQLLETQRAPWAGISPPRQGWESLGSINESRLTQIARDGIAEVAASLPESVGGPIAARIRGEIWGRGIDLESRVPTGAAFAAAGLGFLTEDEEVGLYSAEGWVRLSSEHGHVLAKAATKF
ncbi:MAG: hypothetical protein F2599_01245 [Actinobacteria bacterium]|jgi:hypothetical protein|uniref:Unannotated protein n=1 Tax=freshwater metagenome TaxID=449393 RepID=A0A6J6HZT6_9ZZZZ|nr:hypothetical protein [Actinomycetota bacterium]